MPFIKSAAPKELVEAIDRIETQADECFRPLKLLERQWNIAAWAVLVASVGYIERTTTELGDNSPLLDATLMNMGMVAPIAINWARKHAKPSSTLASRRWTVPLSGEATQAVTLAHQYNGFRASLPMWHKDRYAAELLSPSLVRFTAPGGARERQVSAYQKGMKPTEGQFHQPRPQKEDLSPEMESRFAELVDRCRKRGAIGFKCDPPPWALWRAMLPIYQGRAAAAVRRPNELSLGDYTLGDFKGVYAALMAVCAVHEYLCFRWSARYGFYPLESAIPVHPRSVWRDNLSVLSGIAADICEKVVGDLTLDGTRWCDLHIQPFVALDASRYQLALAPQFPLHSNLDENILRVCSTRRPEVFDAATLDKEAGMRASLEKQCPHFVFRGPLGLTRPAPDIDMVVTDEANSAIAILELKWIRKPFGPFEIIQRDEDVLKGFRQLKEIRSFLTKEPSYLRTYRGLPRPLDAYQYVRYLVVARDHWPWAVPDDGIALIDFNEFRLALSRLQNLHQAIEQLLAYDWLPVEGRDFTVQYESGSVNGVSVEVEVFLPH